MGPNDPTSTGEARREALEAQLRFEARLAELSSGFVDVPGPQVVDAIGRAQQQLGALLGFERSTVWTIAGSDPLSFELLSIVQPEEMPAAPERMDARTHFPWLAEQLLQGKTVLLRTLDDLPPEAALDRQTFQHFGTRSTGIFPLRGEGGVQGVLSFASTRSTREWPDALVTRLTLVAQVFGSALSRRAAEESHQRSEAALRELSGRLIQARERERAWLAKELHDGLNQQLAMLAVELDLLHRQPPGLPELRARLEELSERTKALSGEVHRLSHNLHPSKLERLGLVAAIRGFCRELEAGPVTVQFSSSDVPRMMPPDLALCLYRVAQESLWNVVRHSGARRAVVELHATEAEIHLRVMDDGKGFDAAAAPGADSLGLVSMRERVAMAGGVIRWESSPGGGTTVVARVPLPVEESQ